MKCEKCGGELEREQYTTTYKCKDCGQRWYLKTEWDGTEEFGELE